MCQIELHYLLLDPMVEIIKMNDPFNIVYINFSHYKLFMLQTIVSKTSFGAPHVTVGGYINK
jgi:hypothetical protein